MLCWIIGPHSFRTPPFWSFADLNGQIPVSERVDLQERQLISFSRSQTAKLCSRLAPEYQQSRNLNDSPSEHESSSF